MKCEFRIHVRRRPLKMKKWLAFLLCAAFLIVMFPAPAEVPTMTSFTFRRVKMKPEPGIRAEAAGKLLWPIYGNPFQVIYND